VKLVAIQVECFGGDKADGTPRRYAVEGHAAQVGEVLDRWYQVEREPEWPRAYFKVHADDGRDYRLKHDLESDEWFHGRSW
jgi:hypothetical protein